MLNLYRKNRDNLFFWFTYLGLTYDPSLEKMIFIVVCFVLYYELYKKLLGVKK